MTTENRPEPALPVEPAPPAATGTAVEQAETAASAPSAGRRGAVAKLVQLVYLLFGVLEVLLLLRFALKALAANPQADFAAFVYGVTAPFLAPFVGLFGTPAANGAVLEPHTLVAIVVYALVGWLIARLVWLLVGETRSGVVTEHRASRTGVRS